MSIIKNKKQILKILYYTIIFICVIGLVVKYSSKYILLSEKKALKKSNQKIIILGNITGISRVQKSNGKWISYNFIYQNKEYRNKIMDNFNYKCSRFGDEYVQRKIPVVVDSIHPETNFILFHKRDYVYFNYPIPDTMNWLFNCVEPAGSYFFSPAPISPD